MTYQIFDEINELLRQGHDQRFTRRPVAENITDSFQPHILVSIGLIVGW